METRIINVKKNLSNCYWNILQALYECTCITIFQIHVRKKRDINCRECTGNGKTRTDNSCQKTEFRHLLCKTLLRELARSMTSMSQLTDETLQSVPYAWWTRFFFAKFARFLQIFSTVLDRSLTTCYVVPARKLGILTETIISIF